MPSIRFFVAENSADMAEFSVTIIAERQTKEHEKQHISAPCAAAKTCGVRYTSSGPDGAGSFCVLRRMLLPVRRISPTSEKGREERGFM